MAPGVPARFPVRSWRRSKKSSASCGCRGKKAGRFMPGLTVFRPIKGARDRTRGAAYALAKRPGLPHLEGSMTDPPDPIDAGAPLPAEEPPVPEVPPAPARRRRLGIMRIVIGILVVLLF